MAASVCHDAIFGTLCSGSGHTGHQATPATRQPALSAGRETIKVAGILNPTADLTEYICYNAHSNIRLERVNMLCLCPSNWLGDDCINFYMTLLQVCRKIQEAGWSSMGTSRLGLLM